MGVAAGCGCKKVYRFPHTTYPYSSCICSFLQRHPYFLVSVLFYSSIPSFLKCFLFLFQSIFVIKFYVLHNSPPPPPQQYKHTYGQLQASHGSHMKAAHNVLYMKKHTQMYASYPAIDISCMTSRSEV